MSTTFFARLALCIALMTGALAAHATPITYNLSGVTFSDGTLATGSFVYDIDTGKSAGFNINTTAGILTAFNWSTANSGLYTGGGSGPNNFILMTFAGTRVFNFSFVNPLTNAGGTTLLNTASTYECYNCNPYRRVTAGSVTSLATAVPEPGTLALMLPLLGALVGAARRRKQDQA